MRHRRILVAASGFYEWRRPPKGSKEKSVPYWIRPQQGGIVAFGGLMETYMSADGAEMDTAAVLTVGPNREVAPIHDRMPVVIAPEDFSAAGSIASTRSPACGRPDGSGAGWLFRGDPGLRSGQQGCQQRAGGAGACDVTPNLQSRRQNRLETAGEAQGCRCGFRPDETVLGPMTSQFLPLPSPASCSAAR
jgi:hypothetical protein